jgi:hypothetical protein
LILGNSYYHFQPFSTATRKEGVKNMENIYIFAPIFSSQETIKHYI